MAGEDVHAALTALLKQRGELSDLVIDDPGEAPESGACGHRRCTRRPVRMARQFGVKILPGFMMPFGSSAAFTWAM